MTDGNDSSLRNSLVLDQDTLNLAELDAVAANLDLIVEAAKDLDFSSWPVKPQVPGAVHAAVRGILDETPRSQLRGVAVAISQPGSHDHQLAGHSGGRVSP